MEEKKENNEQIEKKEPKKENFIMAFYHKHKIILWEIFRFLLVGGLATLVDWAICWVAKSIIPTIMVGNWSVDKSLATTCGFCVGLVVNYLLSIIFVYKNKKDEKEGKSVKDFIIFTAIGVFTLLVSYLGIYILSDLLPLDYMIARVIMTAIGLVINYIGRKLLIFK